MTDPIDTEAIAARARKTREIAAAFPGSDKAASLAQLANDISTLLAALATAEERRDQAEFQAEKYEREARTLRNQCVSLDERRERAEAVVEAAEQWEGASLADHARGTAGLGLVSALANYHKATGPQEAEGIEIS